MTLTPPDTDPRPLAEREKESGLGWALTVAAVTMLLTLVPYLIGASLANGRRFMWLGYNLDDSCVYLSWMRQAADGAWRGLNLFTTEPQHGMALNPLFLVLGRIAGWTGLPLLTVYHASRFAFGVCLLLVAWKFILITVATSRAQRIALLMVCFSSGLGWLPFWWGNPPIDAPIDQWQPEAITFLSLYLSPLFCLSMALQVGILLLLFQGERTNNNRYAIFAGLAGFLLGLIHSYDIITVSAIWFVYLLVNSTTKTRFTTLASWLRALLAGAVTAPAVLYIYLQLRSEPVFRARAAVPTLSPSLFWVLMGYGLTLVLTVAALVVLYYHRSSPEPTQVPAETSSDSAYSTPSENHDPEPTPAPTPTGTTGRDAARLLVTWACVNIAASYIPVAFQRKMLQGTHFPIAILAGIAAAHWLQRRLPPGRMAMTLSTLLLLGVLTLTNIAFVTRDVNNYMENRAQTKQQRPFLQTGEIEALQWIEQHTPATTAIQPLPWLAQPDGSTQFYPSDMSLACFTPGLIHRAVYCGHWGETPDYPQKLSELSRFALPTTSDAARLALLRKMRVDYLVFSQKDRSDEAADRLLPMFRGRVPLPSYLILRYSNPYADVYQIVK